MGCWPSKGLFRGPLPRATLINFECLLGIGTWLKCNKTATSQGRSMKCSLRLQTFPCFLVHAYIFIQWMQFGLEFEEVVFPTYQREDIFFRAFITKTHTKTVIFCICSLWDCVRTSSKCLASNCPLFTGTFLLYPDPTCPSKRSIFLHVQFV